MNNLKFYDEYLNERFYDWMNRRVDPDNDPLTILTIVSVVLTLFIGGIWASIAEDWRPIAYLGISNISGLSLISREIFRKLYHKIRSNILLKKTANKYTELREKIKKYPDLELRYVEARRNMIQATQDNDKFAISSVIHDVYNLSKELVKREKIAPMIELTDQEKAEIKEKIDKKKKIDPLGEENWGDEKKWWAKGKKGNE